MTLLTIDSGKATAETNMLTDIELLNSLGSEPRCVLHLYEWQNPSATYGYFNRPDKLLRTEGIAKYGLELSRRPTGGGIIFHQFDFTFSVLLSSGHPHFSLNTLENYRYVNLRVAKAIVEAIPCIKIPSLHKMDLCECENQPTQFCMAKPTIYDLVIDGRKVAGAAQRRNKKGFLHQGSISLQMPSDRFLDDILLPETGVANAIRQSSYPLLGKSQCSASLEAARASLKKALIKIFEIVNIKF